MSGPFQGGTPTLGPWERRVLVAVLVAAAGVWLWVAGPLAAGQRTLFFRDVFGIHLPYKAFGAQELQEGRIPAFNHLWGVGQPFRGNPNTLAFYPGNLLYLVLPFWSAFNLHYALHWLLAALGMAALARRLGQGAPGALVAALAYGGGGWVLSCLTFYNLVTVAAWWPWVLWGAVRGGRKGLAAGGLACGMALLGGEPVSAAIAAPTLLLATRQGRRWIIALRDALVIGGLGLLIAAPQIVAASRILEDSFRGGRGLGAGQAAAYSFHPLRVLELLVPFPFGRASDIGPTGFWAAGLAPDLPFFFSLYCGIVALALAVPALRRRPGWALLALAGLTSAWLGGVSGETLVGLSKGLFRFPEKMLLWPALALPLLAGWGLEGLRRAAGATAKRWAFWARIGAGLLALLALLLAGARPWVLSQLTAQGREAGTTSLVSAQLGLWLQALIVGALLLMLAAWVVRRGRPILLLGLQLAAVLQLHPLVMTDRSEPYRAKPAWSEGLTPGSQLFNSLGAFPEWHPEPAYWVQGSSRVPVRRAKAAELDASWGIQNGHGYPLAPNIEGMGSLLHTILTFNLPRADWGARLNWLRVLGVERAVLYEEPLFEGEPVAGLTLLDEGRNLGWGSRLYRVEDPLPEVWWPAEVAVVGSAPEAFQAVAFAEDPAATLAVVGSSLEEGAELDHREGATVRVLASEADRLVFEVDGPGGVAAVRRSFNSLLEARLGDQELDLLPVNLFMVGIDVPPGRHQVELRAASAAPERAAGALASLVGLGALLTAGGIGPKRWLFERAAE